MPAARRSSSKAGSARIACCREGPFGEWTGYYSGSLQPVPAMEIERLYFRNNPIILGTPPGKPPNDYSYMRALLKSAMIQDELAKIGVRDVRGVWAHETGGGRLLIVVSIKQRFCGHSRQAGYITAQCQAAAYMNRFVIVVDDDVDPMNLEEVMWAVSTRCEPAEDIEIMRKSWGSRVDPLLANPAAPYNSRALIDACRPFEKLDTFPRVAQSTPRAGARDRREVEGTVRGSALPAARDGDSIGRGGRKTEQRHRYRTMI